MCFCDLTAGFAIFDHFRPFPTKFFSPGPKSCLAMPSNSTPMYQATINWVTSIFSWWLGIGTGVEVAKSGLEHQNHGNQQMFQSHDSSSGDPRVLTPSTSLTYISGAMVSLVLL